LGTEDTTIQGFIYLVSFQGGKWFKNTTLSKPINNYHTIAIGAAIPVAWGEINNKVNGKVYPFALWDRKRFQESLFKNGARFSTVAATTVVSILLTVLFYARPVITPKQGPIHGFRAWVSSSTNDVVSLYDSAAQFMVLRNI
jgi:hypothetical protein